MPKPGPTLTITAPDSVARYGLLELVIGVDHPSVGNPFTDAGIVASFAQQAAAGTQHATRGLQHPSALTDSGSRITPVSGFCDSADGTLWRARFCPTTPGEYRYTVRYRDPAGSAEASGTFTCGPEAQGHGFVRRDAAHPPHLICDDGTHVFLAGKTAWRLGCSPHWREFIDQAASQRMNVLRVGVEWTGWPQLPGGICWPWQGTPEAPDFSGFNLAQWQHWDQVLHYAFERGLLIEPCIFTTVSFRHGLGRFPDPDMERYWNYLLARWGAYPGVLLWELYNEFTGLPDYQAYMARYFHAHDPYGRLVTTSAGPIGEEPFPEEGWNDLLVPHYCTGSWMHLDGFYRHYALHHRRHGKPVYVDETGRAGVAQHNDDGEHRRKQYWIWAISGDYCNYHSEGGCYVTLDREPGEQYWEPFVAFWGATEWWRMEPSPRPPAYRAGCPSPVGVYLLGAPDALVAYLCTMDTGAATGPGELTLPLRPGRYQARWYTPATGEYSPSMCAVCDGMLRLEAPAFRDDLALRVDRLE